MPSSCIAAGRSLRSIAHSVTPKRDSTSSRVRSRPRCGRHAAAYDVINRSKVSAKVPSRSKITARGGNLIMGGDSKKFEICAKLLRSERLTLQREHLREKVAVCASGAGNGRQYRVQGSTRVTIGSTGHRIIDKHESRR